jgi:putative NIF3 family GTP cyclohydrolase 1 type 2
LKLGDLGEREWRSGDLGERGAMRLDELRRGLDRLFSISEWARDPAMSRWVPNVYQALDYDYTQILEPDFCARFNGLMLRGGETVEQVFCAAFPCPEVVEAVLGKSKGNALLFLHHPVDMEVAGAGFLAVLPESLERMRARGVSVYACHAPLDCHDEIGTNASIVQAFQVAVEVRFARYGHGYAGRVGTIQPIGLHDLMEKGKRVFGVERVEVGGGQPTMVTRVAIVAGGGDEVALMEEAEGLGAQAYLTGEWYTRTEPPDEGEKRWAEGNRVECQTYAASSEIAMLGFSHAATEYLVMKGQMADYFRRRDLEVECLAQTDWWR